MNEQIINIKFVQEVEKHPCLYNYNLSEYSRRDVTENAWTEVGKTVNLSGSQCKEKWKNIRAVFVRNLKPAPGSGSKRRKPYYLTEAMQFTIPYIKTLSNTPGPSPDHEVFEQEDEVEISLNENDPATSPHYGECRPHFPISCPTLPVTLPSQSKAPLDTNNHNKTSVLTTFDETIINYFNAKKARLEQKDDTDSRKMFLLSLLGDVRSMTDVQMRKFKRKVLSVVDEILEEPGPRPPPGSASSHPADHDSSGPGISTRNP